MKLENRTKNGIIKGQKTNVRNFTTLLKARPVVKARFSPLNLRIMRKLYHSHFLRYCSVSFFFSFSELLSNILSHSVFLILL